MEECGQISQSSEAHFETTGLRAQIIDWEWRADRTLVDAAATQLPIRAASWRIDAQQAALLPIRGAQAGTAAHLERRMQCLVAVEGLDVVDLALVIDAVPVGNEAEVRHGVGSKWCRQHLWKFVVSHILDRGNEL